MQTLKELAYILSKNKLPLVNSLGFPIDQGSKLYAFYEGIKKGMYLSDEDASMALYGDVGTGSYRKLKSDLLDCLACSVAHLDTRQDHFTDYQKSYYECHRQWYIVRVLTGQNANTAALSIANKLLKQAEKHEFTLLCMDIASYLRIQYCIREVNGKKYHEANTAFEHYRALYDAEVQVEQVFTLLSAQSSNNRLNYQSLHEEAKRGYAQLEPLLAKYHSYKVQMYGRLVQLILHTSSHDHAATLACCKEALLFFESKPFRAHAPMQVFLHEQLVCQLQLRLFEEGKSTANRCASILSEGSYNWFKFRELYFLLLMHSCQWGEAGIVFSKTVHHARFTFLPEQVQEAWRVYEAYIHYLSYQGLISPVDGRKKFKIQKFINDTHAFAKDKSGANVAIMIIHYLFLILEQKWAMVLDRVSSLEHYCHRHLSGERDKRSFYFFKLLIQIPYAQFDPVQIEKRAGKFLAALHAHPIESSFQGFEIEVLPYETLWSLLMDSFQRKKRGDFGDLPAVTHYQKNTVFQNV